MKKRLEYRWTACTVCGSELHVREDVEPLCLEHAHEKEMRTMARKKNNGTATEPAPPPAEDPKHAPVVRHKFVQKLPCRIDEPALVTMAEGMAGLYEDLDKAEEERAEVMRGFKQRITGIKENMRDLAKGVRSHTEQRDVECCERLTATGSIEVVRLDTGEILETRAADAMDLQDDLFQETGPDGKADNDPGDDAIDDPDAVLAGKERWTTGPNPKPIQPGA